MNGSAELTNEEKNWGMACHLSVFCAFLGIPFGNIIAPLVIWLVKKDQSKFIDHNGKEVLNFQISILIYLAISLILTFVVIGIVLIIAVTIAAIVLTIIAAVQTSKGEWYRYPMTIRLIK
jgi:uncharacterized protein